MPHILKNKNLELKIDLPFENYDFTRFDQTGKIVDVIYKGTYFSTIERTDNVDQNKFGQGFYNEFGLEIPVGFDERKIGEWFPKIGVGLLKKNSEEYSFLTPYQLRPAKFEISSEEHQIRVVCEAEVSHGYSYLLIKTISLEPDGFTINYELKNTGVHDIITAEYVHNFMSIDKDLIGENFILKFPFDLSPENFHESADPYEIVCFSNNKIEFKKPSEEPIFFSHLNGKETVQATWELINTKKKLGIRESGDFNTDKVNLWGWSHVISPELFYKIHLKPDETDSWTRKYEFFETD